MIECRIPGCDDDVFIQRSGLCRTHYNRQYKGVDLHKPLVRRDKARTRQDLLKILRRTTKVSQPSKDECGYELKRPCRKWHKHINPGGYGTQVFRGKIRKAHVLAWMVSRRRRVPKGRIICHKCHRRWCVQPEHLYLGTYQTNSDDTVAVGHLVTTLTHEDVRDIRRRGQHGQTQTSIARIYGVHQTTVRDVLVGNTWRHVA